MENCVNINHGGKVMKKLFLTIITLVLLTVSIWGKDYKYTYDEMVEMKKDWYECFFAVPDEQLYDFAVYVWRTYFHEYYRKVGIPFIVCYDSSEQSFSEGTAYHKSVRLNGEYYFSIIAIVDKTHEDGFNASDKFEKILGEKNYTDEYCISLIAHELCHVIVALEWTKEQIKEHPSHYNSIFLREANRLLDEYDLDVHVY